VNMVFAGLIFMSYWNLLVVAKARVAQDRLDFWVGLWIVHGVMIPILLVLFVQRVNPFLLRFRRRAP
jgi:lipopolysaccharide export system permease protein